MNLTQSWADYPLTDGCSSYEKSKEFKLIYLHHIYYLKHNSDNKLSKIDVERFELLAKVLLGEISVITTQIKHI